MSNAHVVMLKETIDYEIAQRSGRGWDVPLQKAVCYEPRMRLWDEVSVHGISHVHRISFDLAPSTLL